MTEELRQYLQKAREHYDRILDENIAALVEKTRIERERFVRINPCDFLETISGFIQSNGDIAKFVEQHKTPDTFLISPLDAVEETAAQICYKTNQSQIKLRAHKCSVVPIPARVAQSFCIKNHRQTASVISSESVSFALVYENEIVACMTYDKTAGAVRGKSRKDQYELLRLAIRKGYQINGGASKLQKACEEALMSIGCFTIFSYSNATINEGGVYAQLGFAKGKIQSGRAYVIMHDFELQGAAPFSTNCGSAANWFLRKYGFVKTNISANRMWTKQLRRTISEHTTGERCSITNE